MARYRPLNWVFAFSALVLWYTIFAAEKAETDNVIRDKSEFTAEESKLIAGLPNLIGSLAEVALFEGLPHPYFEEKLRVIELSTHESLDIQGEKFYPEKRAFTRDDAEKVFKLLNTKSTYEPTMWGKLCGGFHADYAIQWKRDDGVTTVLLCLGCGEIRITGPKIKLVSDIALNQVPRLREILFRYRKYRPTTKYLNSLSATPPIPPPAPVRSSRGS